MHLIIVDMKKKLFLFFLLGFVCISVGVYAGNNGLNKKYVRDANFVVLLNAQDNNYNIYLQKAGKEDMFITLSHPVTGENKIFNVTLPTPTRKGNEISIVGISDKSEAVMLKLWLAENKTLRCSFVFAVDDFDIKFHQEYLIDLIGFSSSLMYLGNPKYDTNNKRSFEYFDEWLKYFVMYVEK